MKVNEKSIRLRQKGTLSREMGDSLKTDMVELIGRYKLIMITRNHQTSEVLLS